MATQLKLFAKVCFLLQQILDAAVQTCQLVLTVQPRVWLPLQLLQRTSSKQQVGPVMNLVQGNGLPAAEESAQRCQRSVLRHTCGQDSNAADEWQLEGNNEERSICEESVDQQQQQQQSAGLRLLPQKKDQIGPGLDLRQQQADSHNSCETEENEFLVGSSFRRCRSFAQNLCEIPLGSSVVIPGKLYLGGQLSVSAETALAKLSQFNVGVVVNVTEDFEWECVDGLVSVRFSVRDVEEEGQRLFDFFEEFYELVEQWNSKGKAVLVHCRYGVSRSASMVLAYLMRSRGWSIDEALDYLSGQRPCINPNGGFYYHLIQYERMLRGGDVHQLQANKDERRVSKSQTRNGQLRSWCQTSVQEFQQKSHVEIPEEYVLGKMLFVGLDYMLQKGGRQGCLEQQWYMALMQEAINKVTIEEQQSAYLRNFFLTSILSPEQLNNWIMDIPRTTNLIAEVLVATRLTQDLQEALYMDLHHFLQEQQLLQGEFLQQVDQWGFGRDLEKTKKVLDMVANSFIPDMDLYYFR